MHEIFFIWKWLFSRRFRHYAFQVKKTTLDFARRKKFVEYDELSFLELAVISSKSNDDDDV